MSVFSRILVLIDCSAVDQAIVSKILEIGKSANRKITLVHVIHSHTLDQDRDLRQKSEVCMKKLEKQFIAQGLKPSLLLLSGEPEEELLKEINEGQYDLVALATHGHKILGDILYGSVSDTLKHNIKIPLLMVRGYL